MLILVFPPSEQRGNPGAPGRALPDAGPGDGPHVPRQAQHHVPQAPALRESQTEEEPERSLPATRRLQAQTLCWQCKIEFQLILGLEVKGDLFISLSMKDIIF